MEVFGLSRICHRPNCPSLKRHPRKSVFSKEGILIKRNFRVKFLLTSSINLTWNRYYTHNPEDPTSNSFMFMFYIYRS